MLGKILSPISSATSKLSKPDPKATGSGDADDIKKPCSQPTPKHSGPIYFESKCQPTTHSLCWTIKDFRNTAAQPKLLQSYVLEFKDSVPKVQFKIGMTKKEGLFLRPKVPSADKKKHGKLFVKYGFSVGPHNRFHEDFSLESPTIQVKKLNNIRLNILESKILQHSYLVEGNLNLIVRLTSFKATTLAAPSAKLPAGNLLKSCSQFVMGAGDIPEELLVRRNFGQSGDIPEDPLVGQNSGRMDQLETILEDIHKKTSAQILDTRASSNLKQEQASQIQESVFSEPFSGINGTGQDFQDLDSGWEEEISILGRLRGTTSDDESDGTSSWVTASKIKPLEFRKVLAPRNCNCNLCVKVKKPKKTPTKRRDKKPKSRPYKSSLIYQFKTDKDISKFGSKVNSIDGTDGSGTRRPALPIPLHHSTPLIVNQID